MLFALLLRGKLHRSIMSLFLYGLPGWMQSDSRAVGNLDDPTDNENGSMNMYGINGSACDASLGRNCEDPDNSTFRAWQNGLT